MGGISAGYSQNLNINFINPASLGNFYNTIFELGAEVDIRSIKSTSNPGKYTSRNAVISYLQLGFPLSSKKMKKNGTNWGMSFGLRPVSRINYKIEDDRRLAGVDSLNTLYEGSGGLNQANFSTGIKFGKDPNKNEFSLGVSTGYSFGTKDFSTRIILANDTVAYYKSNSEVQSRFGGMFVTAGLQYLARLPKEATFRLGAYANLQQTLKAKRSTINETFGYDGNGTAQTIDSVSITNDVEGKVIIPATYGAGLVYTAGNKHWLIGMDVEFSNWSAYRFYNEKENTNNSWVIRAGAEFSPADPNAPSRNYWSYVKYRAGFYFGPDYIKLKETRNNYAATLGASFPLTSKRAEFVLLNTSIEAGGRGNKQSFGVRENFMRINFGISMNAGWFRKRNYD
jgi:hypothetical protein